VSNYPHLAARLYNAPLLITPAKAEVIERVFRAHLEGTAPALAPMPQPTPTRPDMELAAIGGATRTQAGYLRTSDGVALISVLGSLVQRGSGMDAMSGLESYDVIGSKLDAALADPMVRGILLEIDSAGGEGAGLFDLAARVRAADAVKPVTAHANEQAFSAAYALAASAGELYVASTGMVGSVGVIMLHVDQSAYDAKRGLTYTPITFGDRKADFSPHAPLSDAALATAQSMVDRLGETFVAHVANMRGIDAQTVRDTQAGILHPDQAHALGMVDGTATLGEAVASLRKRIADPWSTSFSRAAGANHERNDIMAIENKPAATVATAEQLAAERAAGLAEGQAAASTQAAASATAERERVAGILGHAEADGRRKLAEHLAFKTSNGVDDAVALLAASPKESAAPANPLAAAMTGVPNPKIGADATASAEAPAAAALDSGNIFQLRREAVRKSRQN
jgi:capsid assembly protease